MKVVGSCGQGDLSFLGGIKKKAHAPRTHTHTHTHTHPHTHTHTHTHARTRTRTRTRTHTHTHTHTHNARTRTHTHTHTHAREVFGQMFTEYPPPNSYTFLSAEQHTASPRRKGCKKLLTKQSLFFHSLEHKGTEQSLMICNEKNALLAAHPSKSRDASKTRAPTKSLRAVSPGCAYAFPIWSAGWRFRGGQEEDPTREHASSCCTSPVGSHPQGKTCKHQLINGIELNNFLKNLCLP